MKNKKVKDLMVYHTIFINSFTTLQEAARAMKDADCDILPVGSPDRLEGTITDRDLVIRAIINGHHSDKPVADYMEKQVTFCYENDTLEEATDKMYKHNLHRILVKNAQKNITGILSLIDILKFNAAQKSENDLL